MSALRPVSLPVPRLVLYQSPQLFSRHDKIAGEHLVTAQYNALSPAARYRLGRCLNSHASTAVRKLPKWRSPLGLGA